MSEDADKEYADRLLGKLFGFSQCCIDFYVSTPSNALRRSKAVLGLRLCPECQRKDLEDVVNDLGTRRICPQPFPSHPSEADFASLVSDPRFNPQEQAWLETNKDRYIYQRDYSDQLLLDHHGALNQINANCEEKISKEPHRIIYFLALKELEIRAKQRETLDILHKIMHERVIDQVRAGHLKI